MSFSICFPFAIKSNFKEKALKIIAISLIFSTWTSKTYSNSINRLQYRVHNNGDTSISQSSFKAFSDSTFLLRSFERTDKNNSEHYADRFEIITGKNLSFYNKKSALGIVARAQKWSNNKRNLSLGLNLDLNNFKSSSSILDKYKVKTFIQFYFNTEELDTGRREILHYYQVKDIFDIELYIRGINTIYFEKENINFNLFSDLILPIDKGWDVYARWSYLNRDIGESGHTLGFGVRFSF